MYIFKLKKLYKLISEKKLEEAHSFAYNLIKLYPVEPLTYVALAKICFRKGEIEECKKTLLKMFLLPNWYKDKIVREILDITNWKMLVSHKYFCKEPKFSYDGEKIIFCCATEDTNGDGKINNDDRPGIYIIDRTGKNLQCIVENKYYNSSVCFSPDGEHICFLSAREDTNGDGKIDSKDLQGLYLLNLRTGEEKLLVENVYRPKHPSFSPYGDKIIFSCWRQPSVLAKSGIYEIDLKTLTLKNVVPDNYESVFPSYSPDGEYILYSSFCTSIEDYGGPQHKCGIFIKRLSTNETKLIASPEYINSFPIFSNNGKKVAFLSKRRDTNNDGVINSLDNDGIYIYDLNKNREYCVHPDKYYNKFINFTYDDKYIVFLSTWHTKYKELGRDYFEYKGIYMCKTTGGKVKQIVSDKYYGCHSPDVSPKRYEVVYTAFRKDTLRGLYLAYLDRLPSKEEISVIVNNNL